MPLQKGDLPAFFFKISTLDFGQLWFQIYLRVRKEKKTIWIKITIHTFTMKILKISYFHKKNIENTEINYKKVIILT